MDGHTAKTASAVTTMKMVAAAFYGATAVKVSAACDSDTRAGPTLVGAGARLPLCIVAAYWWLSGPYVHGVGLLCGLWWRLSVAETGRRDSAISDHGFFLLCQANASTQPSASESIPPSCSVSITLLLQHITVKTGLFSEVILHILLPPMQYSRTSAHNDSSHQLPHV